MLRARKWRITANPSRISLGGLFRAVIVLQLKANGSEVWSLPGAVDQSSLMFAQALHWDRGRPRPQRHARVFYQKTVLVPNVAGEGARGPSEEAARLTGGEQFFEI